MGLNTLQDKFIDITGHQIDWHDKEDGWTEERRQKVWKYKFLMLDQYKNLPAYTKSGYKKMSMPTELHNLIVQSLKLNSTKFINEELNEGNINRNWQRVNPDGSKGGDDF